MNSVCVSKCINDAGDPRIPVRATYVNLYKWPESDAEFVRRSGRQNPQVVYSMSCRQMYLRSYTFSREEEIKNPDTTTQNYCCFGKDNKLLKKNKKENENDKEINRKKKKKKKKKRKKQLHYCLALRKALCRVFHRLLSCAASIDVVDQNH